MQLSFWPDDTGQVTVQCPHCGCRFDAGSQLKQHRAEMEQRVLAHPRVQALPARTRDFLAAALPAFYVARAVGVSEIAETAAYSPSGAHGQIMKLVGEHVFKSVPKGSKYNQYQLAI